MVILNGNETFAEITGIFKAPKELRFLLTKAALTRLLERYANGELARQQLFEMCYALEWRENVEYEEPYHEVIGSALFRMATPKIPDAEDWIDVPVLMKELTEAKPS